MIPIHLQELVEKQTGRFRRSNIALAERALTELGIPDGSEFAQFYRSYRVSSFHSSQTHFEIVDVAEPSFSVSLATKFIHEVWKLPDEYVCFSSVEGEGGYLYSKRMGEVWDFDLATREEFMRGEIPPRWKSLFEFMIWYLS